MAAATRSRRATVSVSVRGSAIPHPISRAVALICWWVTAGDPLYPVSGHLSAERQGWPDLLEVAHCIIRASVHGVLTCAACYSPPVLIFVCFFSCFRACTSSCSCRTRLYFMLDRLSAFGWMALSSLSFISYCGRALSQPCPILVFPTSKNCVFFRVYVSCLSRAFSPCTGLRLQTSGGSYVIFSVSSRPSGLCVEKDAP